ncbi:beta-lactamase (plasmid) [Azospirillum argentinense]|uniref:Beta-lactamase n=1 Tax=Azospirillum argentinense TaxID=2970906 RepID=A0A060DUE8_9PROT|nr:serine hydrolase domain-containing protein [Azospirillum argentinense]AIB16382.1 beta-lactamase [Azospirillum argentinense]EZQ02480.1 beta-lactamase [Azospirillum argentinense]
MDRYTADRLTRLLDEGDGPAAARAAVVAVRSGPHSWTTGLARSGAPLPPATARFLIYSITKTLTAAALLRLCERGLIDPDAPLDRWLPDFAAAGRITLAQLLAHRAGLRNYGGSPAYHAAVRAGEEPWSEDGFLEHCRASDLFAPPGREFSYSNIGYLLAKRVLERASGLPFAQALDRELFGPLALTGWSVPTERGDLSGLWTGPSPYLGGKDGLPADVAARYHPGWVAHGVVAATAADIADLLHALFAGGLLPGAAAARMQESFPVPGTMRGRPWVEPGYGLGLMVERDGQAGPYWGHTGGGPGGSACAYHFPARKPGEEPVTVALFTDGEDNDQAEWMTVEAVESLRE